jgi:hypothetical protein
MTSDPATCVLGFHTMSSKEKLKILTAGSRRVKVIVVFYNPDRPSSDTFTLQLVQL